MSTSTPRKESRPPTAVADAEKGSSVQVVVRMRPPSEKEKANNDPMVVGVYPQHSEVRVMNNFKKGPASVVAAPAISSKDAKTYTFDQTFGALSTQEEVYSQAVRPLVDEVLAGFNCTVFAYGQTGTGKTHTIAGDLSLTLSENSGVIPRSIHTIFEQLSEGKYEDYSVKVSFLQLYNEELSDLLVEQEDRTSSSSMSMSAGLANDSEKKELRIFEDVTGKKGMMVHGLEEVGVTNTAQVFALLAKANKNRAVAETNLNARSSRSHLVFTVTVHTKEYSEDGEDIIKTGKLYLVDLAGSECIGKSGATDKRAKEAGKINQSLLTLGRVINALVDRASFVPYRDSKLTRLLQESLGGRAKTLILATVSPSAAAYDETLSTLDYAHRAKSIKNKPCVNQKMTKRAYMKELLVEIASLKRDNEVLRSKNGIIVPPEKWERMQAEATGKGMQIDELLFKINKQQTSMDELQAKLTEKETLLTEALEQKAEVESAFAHTVCLLESTRATLAETRENLVASQNLLIQLQRLLHAREAELAETRAVVAAQKATEATLTGQACGVIDTLTSTLVDKDALHAKIDRKAAVESHNKLAADAFNEKSLESLSALSGTELALQNQVAAAVEETKSAIEQADEKTQTKCRELDQMRGKFDQAIESQTNQMQRQSTDFTESHIAALHTHADAAADFHARTAKSYAEFAATNTTAFAGVSNQVSNLQTRTAGALETSAQDLRTAHVRATGFARTDLAPRMEQLAAASAAHSTEAMSASNRCLQQLSSFESSQKSLVAADADRLRARISQMQAEMLASIQAMQANFMSEVSAMIDAHTVQQATQVEQRVREIAEEVRETVSKETAAQTAAQAAIHSIQSSSEQFASEVDSWSSEAAQRNTHSAGELNAAFVQLKSTMTTDHSAEETTVQALVDSNLARQSAAQIESTEAITQVREYNALTARTISEMSGTVKDHSTAVSTWTSATSTESTSTAASIHSQVDVVSGIMAAHATAFDGLASGMSASLDTFVSSDLKADQPLGTTPQKVVVSHTRREELAATDSPTAVVRAFRDEIPVPPLVFRGVLVMDGVEEVDLQPMPTSIVAPIDIDQMEIALEASSTASTPTSADTSVSSVRDAAKSFVSSRAPTPTAAGAAPLAIAIDDSEECENARPSPAHSNVSSSTDSCDKAPLKRSTTATRSALATAAGASKIAPPTAATAVNKPVTRSRFGYAAPTEAK